MPTPKATPTAVLNLAAAYLAVYGLHRGEYWPGAATGKPYSEGMPCCALGAIAVAMKPRKPDKISALASEPARVLRNRVAKLPGSRGSIVSWNDNASVEEIISLMQTGGPS